MSAVVSILKSSNQKPGTAVILADGSGSIVPLDFNGPMKDAMVCLVTTFPDFQWVLIQFSNEVRVECPPTRNIQLVINKIKDMKQLRSGTETIIGLQTAWDYLRGPDMCMLWTITDGDYSGNPTIIRQEMRNVHCFALGVGQGIKSEQLERLASRNETLNPYFEKGTHIPSPWKNPYCVRFSDYTELLYLLKKIKMDFQPPTDDLLLRASPKEFQEGDYVRLTLHITNNMKSTIEEGQLEVEIPPTKYFEKLVYPLGAGDKIIPKISPGESEHIDLKLQIVSGAHVANFPEKLWCNIKHGIKILLATIDLSTGFMRSQYKDRTNVLTFGCQGSGKSSTISSIYTCFSIQNDNSKILAAIEQGNRTDDGEIKEEKIGIKMGHTTQEYSVLPVGAVLESDPAEMLEKGQGPPLHMYDTWGVAENEYPYGIKAFLEGRVPIGTHKDDKKDYKNEKVNAEHIIHCVVIVLPLQATEEDREEVKKFADEAATSGYNSLLVLTKYDRSDPKYIDKTAREVAKDIGIAMSEVFVIKNYTDEIFRSTKLDIDTKKLTNKIFKQAAAWRIKQMTKGIPVTIAFHPTQNIPDQIVTITPKQTVHSIEEMLRKTHKLDTSNRLFLPEQICPLSTNEELLLLKSTWSPTDKIHFNPILIKVHLPTKTPSLFMVNEKSTVLDVKKKFLPSHMITLYDCVAKVKGDIHVWEDSEEVLPAMEKAHFNIEFLKLVEKISSVTIRYFDGNTKSMKTNNNQTVEELLIEMGLQTSTHILTVSSTSGNALNGQDKIVPILYKRDILNNGELFIHEKIDRFIVNDIEQCEERPYDVKSSQTCLEFLQIIKSEVDPDFELSTETKYVLSKNDIILQILHREKVRKLVLTTRIRSIKITCLEVEDEDTRTTDYDIETETLTFGQLTKKVCEANWQYCSDKKKYEMLNQSLTTLAPSQPVLQYMRQNPDHKFIFQEKIDSVVIDIPGKPISPEFAIDPQTTVQYCMVNKVKISPKTHQLITKSGDVLDPLALMVEELRKYKVRSVALQPIPICKEVNVQVLEGTKNNTVNIKENDTCEGLLKLLKPEKTDKYEILAGDTLVLPHVQVVKAMKEAKVNNLHLRRHIHSIKIKDMDDVKKYLISPGMTCIQLLNSMQSPPNIYLLKTSSGEIIPKDQIISELIHQKNIKLLVLYKIPQYNTVQVETPSRKLKTLELGATTTCNNLLMMVSKMANLQVDELEFRTDENEVIGGQDLVNDVLNRTNNRPLKLKPNLRFISVTYEDKPKKFEVSPTETVHQFLLKIITFLRQNDPSKFEFIPQPTPFVLSPQDLLVPIMRKNDCTSLMLQKRKGPSVNVVVNGTSEEVAVELHETFEQLLEKCFVRFSMNGKPTDWEVEIGGITINMHQNIIETTQRNNNNVVNFVPAGW